MKLRIGHRVWLVIALLLFLFFSTSAVSYLLTKRIEDSVNQLAFVDDVSLQAVTTMDARLEEIVRAVTVYALDAGEVDREHLKALVFEFSNAATTYMRLSTVEDQRRLANDALKSSKPSVRALMNSSFCIPESKMWRSMPMIRGTSVPGRCCM